MGRSRNLADLLDANGDVKATGLDNVPPSNDASALTTGTLSADRLGAGSISAAKLADTYLTPTGDGSNLTGIASDQLTTSLPIATGETCTAGKILSINSSGEVGEYPATPTLGTVRSGGDSYFAFTHDGSRALVIDVTYPSQTQVTYTYTGYVIDASNNATAGTPQTRTLSSGITGNVSHGGYKYCLYDSTNDKFVVYTMHYARDTSANHFVDYDLQAIDVNSSTGNLTMGSVNNVYSNTEGGGPDYFTVGMSKIKDGHYIISNSSGRAQSRPFTYQCVTLSGTTFTISTDADASDIVGRLYYSDNDALRATVYTAGNYVVGLNSNDAFRATYTTRNVSAVTTQANIFTDNENGNIWWHTISSTLAVAAYRDSDLVTKLRLFSIDSSTGVLTSEDTIVIENTGYHDTWQFANQDSTGLLIMYRTASLGTYTVRAVGLSGSTFTGKTLATGFTSQTGSMYARPTATTSEYLFFRNGGVNHESLTVTAYSSDPFVAIGAVNSTTSTSPATVVIGGVIDGFTGLTPGEFYYVANTYDGDVSTSSATGIAVGTAISSTKIAIRMTEV